MMPLFLRSIAVAITFASAGCASLYHLDEYSTAETKADAAGEAGADAGADHETTDGGDGGGCRSNVECNTTIASSGALPDGGTAPSVCIPSTRQCAPLLSADCPRFVGDYTNDRAIIVGTILGSGAGDSDATLERSALLAAEEIDAPPAGGGIAPAKGQTAARPLVVVACEASANVVRAAHHLVDDLHVPAIVGPTAAEDVVAVTGQVSVKGGALLITPTSTAAALTDLADDDLTWRAIPSDGQRGKLVNDQMSDLENLVRTARSLTTVKLGIVRRTDLAGTSSFDAISGTVMLNEHFLNDASNAANVSVDSCAAGDTAAAAAIVTNYASGFKPDLVYLTAPEQVTTIMVPLEQRLTDLLARNHPYYICTDALKTQALLTALASASPALPSDIRRRIRGIGLKPDTASVQVLADFNTAFAARYGHAPAPLTTTEAYDSMYAIAFAIAATPDEAVSGASVARGLRKLGVGDAFTVGAKQAYVVMQSLAAGTSVSVRGTYGPLQWDANGDVAGGTVDVWCVGATSGAFGSSGRTMDVKTQVIGGQFVQCQ